MLINPPKPNFESSDLVFKGVEHNRVRRKKLRCDYCKWPWHTRETFGKYMKNPTIRGKSNLVTIEIADAAPQVSSGIQPFTKEQIEQTCNILSYQNLDNSSCSMAQKWNYHIACCLNTNSNTSWIIDSGASDHMTGSSKLFSSYSLCAGN